MNLESNTTPKLNKQYIKSKYNNQQTLTSNYIVTDLHSVSYIMAFVSHTTQSRQS